MKKSFIFIFLAALCLPVFVSAACLDLPADLGTGSTDRNSSGQVLPLQRFLQEEGLLTATPNGVYGPATTAAVRAYQSRTDLPATGFVGPLTRSVIKARSCNVTTTETNTSTQPQSSAQTTATLAPKNGATLTIGKTFGISLDSSKLRPQSIILEDKDGVAKGYVASNLIAVAEFQWTVGRVYSSATGNNELVTPGEYRLRVIDAQTGITASDPVSGVFTLEGEYISIDSMRPTTVQAAAGQAVVLYGSGFTTSSRVYLGGYRNIEVERLFVSSDGTVFVFSVPKSTPASRYFLTVSNRYGTTDTATILTVTP
ncbi:MAG TPA: peptidoglycan-binding domain-containing protein [Candidatus Paceibacterota bacterium]|jgi:Putative peptidoglycan-binding domain-containing protein